MLLYCNIFEIRFRRITLIMIINVIVDRDVQSFMIPILKDVEAKTSRYIAFVNHTGMVSSNFFNDVVIVYNTSKVNQTDKDKCRVMLKKLANCHTKPETGTVSVEIKYRKFGIKSIPGNISFSKESFWNKLKFSWTTAWINSIPKISINTNEGKTHHIKQSVIGKKDSWKDLRINVSCSSIPQDIIAGITWLGTLVTCNSRDHISRKNGKDWIFIERILDIRTVTGCPNHPIKTKSINKNLFLLIKI